MNEFKESLKVSKEQLEYEEYKRKRFAKEIHKEKWDNARKRLEGEEKQKGLEGLIDKYSSQHREAGMEYIAKAGVATDVFVIQPDRISGKARRK